MSLDVACVRWLIYVTNIARVYSSATLLLIIILRTHHMASSIDFYQTLKNNLSATFYDNLKTFYVYY